MFFLGLYFGQRGYSVNLVNNPPKIEILNKRPISSEVDFSLFWEVWDEVNASHLERPLDPEKLLYGAISGMVDAIGDPYTSFLPPELNESVNASLDGKYEGIGAELGFREDQLIIVAPFEGSPAIKSGVRAGDKIIKINGEMTVGLSITEAVAKIRGAAGTEVVLTLQRGDATSFDISIVRGVITVDSVTWEYKGDGIAYIRVSRFGGSTNAEWSKAVEEITVQVPQLDSVVLDLRGNPGGYLQSAVYLAEEFLNKKVVVIEQFPDGNEITLKADRVGKFEKLPKIIILLDGGSASASEILASALKDNLDTVTIVGTTSFGKGTIQDVREFKEDGSALHVSIAKWLTPNKEWVHKKGIEPDVLVEVSDEDLANELDPQLDRALELAK